VIRGKYGISGAAQPPDAFAQALAQVATEHV
jgi:hypothetical protein